jgi:hypothetical protein
MFSSYDEVVRLVLSGWTRVVLPNLVVREAVVFLCSTLLLPGEDDVAGITAGIDDVAEVGRG